MAARSTTWTFSKSASVSGSGSPEVVGGLGSAPTRRPSLRPEDKGIVVAEVIESVVDDRNERFIVNVMNEGLIPNLLLKRPSRCPPS